MLHIMWAETLKCQEADEPVSIEETAQAEELQ